MGLPTTLMLFPVDSRLFPDGVFIFSVDLRALIFIVDVDDAAEEMEGEKG